VTVSVGVGSLDAHVTDGTQLIAAADAALYEAKRAGRNRVVTYKAG
jgi:diguanylate cyclase (GGDEF)-like protein